MGMSQSTLSMTGSLGETETEPPGWVRDPCPAQTLRNPNLSSQADVPEPFPVR